MTGDRSVIAGSQNYFIGHGIIPVPVSGFEFSPIVGSSTIGKTLEAMEKA